VTIILWLDLQSIPIQFRALARVLRDKSGKKACEFSEELDDGLKLSVGKLLLTIRAVSYAL
jgi:hypothetical protein